ncbi:DNA repair protein RadA [Candidatus Peregrinibacteria bacterium]|nr:DNA repair protein RadA [Candidatus Peregrinibacteria bacterium]
MKLKTIYICSKCGAESPKWAGQCFKCQAWNTLVEDVVDLSPQKMAMSQARPAKVEIAITNVKFKDTRFETGISELDRVLGGGFVRDSVVLLAGDPGIGKSTLTLQVCAQYAAKNKKVLYLSGEESIEQISGRAERLKITSPCALLNENNLETILATLSAEKPDFAVIDSVQVMASEQIPSQAGSVSQIRYVTEQLMQFAKANKVSLLLIGHVTKDGQLAGPQVLTHLVDTVLYLEGDAYHNFRLLKSAKNRFGAVDEVGVFTMEEQGMIPVKNPSAIFLEGRSKNPIGSIVFPTVEGTRAFLVEVQALTAYTQFGYPKRTADGFPINRLNIIIAALNRYAQLKLDSSDIFVNVVGGLKLDEPAADLAVAMAIVSSKSQKAVPEDLFIFGEMGLSGEVRSVMHLEKRLKEAEKLGFKKAIIPFVAKLSKTNLQIVAVRTVAEAVKELPAGAEPKRSLAKQLAKESKLVRENSMEVLKEFEALEDPISE